MFDESLPADTRRALRRAVPSLGFTGIVNWGTTYYLPAVLRDRFEADLGLSDTAIFAGVAVTLIVSALAAWPAGSMIDRRGAKQMLPVGSVFLASGLLVLAFSNGATSYFLAWGLFGIGMALGMSSAAFAALTQIAGPYARRPITLLMLFGGMAATFLWPLTMWLDSQIGWRSTLMVYAAAHVFICVPMHLFLPGRSYVAAPAGADRTTAETGLVAPGKRRLAAGLIALMLAGNGFVAWGIDLHLITFFQTYGLTAAVAVSLAAAKGPFTLVARVFEIAASGRVGPLFSSFAGALLVTLSLIVALSWREGFAAAMAFMMVHAFGTGLLAVARATLPLSILGADGYATTMGKIALPTQIVYAVSPMIYTMMVQRLGDQGALQIAACASLISLGSLVLLRRLLARPE